MDVAEKRPKVGISFVRGETQGGTDRAKGDPNKIANPDEINIDEDEDDDDDDDNGDDDDDGGDDDENEGREVAEGKCTGVCGEIKFSAKWLSNRGSPRFMQILHISICVTFFQTSNSRRKRFLPKYSVVWELPVKL